MRGVFTLFNFGWVAAPRGYEIALVWVHLEEELLLYNSLAPTVCTLEPIARLRPAIALNAVLVSALTTENCAWSRDENSQVEP
jgi:hypothetical protein